MKKVIFIMLVALTGMLMQGKAQNRQSLRVPFFKEILKVKEGTAFSKTPNSTSEKLVIKNEDFYNYFGWDKVGENAYQDMVGVNGESGDWYHVLVSDEYLGSENAYIPKNAATKVQTKALAFPAPDYIFIDQIKTGKYKDWYIQFIEEGMDTDALICLGVPIEGKILMLRRIKCSATYSDNPSVLVDGDSDNGEWAGHKILRYGNDLQDSDTGGVSISKLLANTKLVEAMIDNFYSCLEYYSLFFGVAGDNDWHQIVINKDSFKGQLYEIK